MSTELEQVIMFIYTMSLVMVTKIEYQSVALPPIVVV